jgi:hypothetical protein
MYCFSKNTTVPASVTGPIAPARFRFATREDPAETRYSRRIERVAIIGKIVTVSTARNRSKRSGVIETPAPPCGGGYFMRASHRQSTTPPFAVQSDESLTSGASPGDERPGLHSGSLNAAPPQRDFTETLAAIPLDWDDWELDDDLRQAKRITQSVAGGAYTNTPSFASHAQPTQPQTTHSVETVRHRAINMHPPTPSVLSWAVLLASLIVFFCGAVLIGWSFFDNQPDLWKWGAPLTLLGQLGWVVGMMLQVERLWQRHREVVESVGEMEVRIAELNETTAQLATMRAAAAPSFYAHLAEGAAPQLLLADLKGQLDLLARQLDRRKAA